MQVIFKIKRQTLRQPSHEQTYTLDIEPGLTVLDALNQIKWYQDGTLAFRKNCRNTICGSCAMQINGRAALACQNSIRQELDQAIAPDTITIAPMGNMPVIRDLVVDMQGFWQNLGAVDPYVSAPARQLEDREFLQSPGDREKLNQAGNCILCGACYSDCNAREVNPAFVGPHALAKAYRVLADSRDQARGDRLEAYNNVQSGVWGCTRCFNCNTVCPMDVAPLNRISDIKGAILETKTADDTVVASALDRPLRHRLVLINLVKEGGWIDERKFGLRVLGNGFRDWRGLGSLVPLGVRMLGRGKFPFRFHPSTAQEGIRKLIEAVQSWKKGGPRVKS